MQTMSKGAEERFEIQDIVESDIDDIAVIASDALQHNVVEHMLFSDMRNRDKQVIDFWKYTLAQKLNPRKDTVSAFKLVAKPSGKTVGWTLWSHVKSTDPPRVAVHDFPPNLRADTCGIILNGGLEMAEKYLNGTEYLCLNNLYIAPEYQNRGLGSRLINLCLNDADKLQLRVYLIATANGYGLYKARKFEVIDQLNVDISQYLGKDLGFGMFVGRYMIRQPQQAQ